MFGTNNERFITLSTSFFGLGLSVEKSGVPAFWLPAIVMASASRVQFSEKTKKSQTRGPARPVHAGHWRALCPHKVCTYFFVQTDRNLGGPPDVAGPCVWEAKENFSYVLVHTIKR